MAVATGFGAGLGGTADPYPLDGDITGPAAGGAAGAGAGGRPEVGITGAGGITGRGWGVDRGRAGGDPPGEGVDRMVGPEIDDSDRMEAPSDPGAGDLDKFGPEGDAPAPPDVVEIGDPGGGGGDPGLTEGPARDGPAVGPLCRIVASEPVRVGAPALPGLPEPADEAGLDRRSAGDDGPDDDGPDEGDGDWTGAGGDWTGAGEACWRGEPPSCPARPCPPPDDPPPGDPPPEDPPPGAAPDGDEADRPCPAWELCRFLDGTKSWFAVGGPLDAAGAGGGAGGGLGRACTGWRIVAEDDWVAWPPLPVDVPGRAGEDVRTVTDESAADAEALPPGTVGSARVLSLDVPDGAPGPADPVVTAAVRSDCSVLLPLPARFAEPVPVPARDT